MKEQSPLLRKAAGESLERSIFQLESGGSKGFCDKAESRVELYNETGVLCSERKLGLRTTAAK